MMGRMSTTDTTQTSNPEVTIVGVTRKKNGMYVVCDALHRNHYAADEHGLGVLVAQLVADEELPKSRIETEQNESIGIAAGIARKLTGRLAPELLTLVDAVEPAAHAIAGQIARTRATTRRRKAKTRVVRDH